MKYKKQICLKTIAYELNVSINTVSRALRDCDDISEKTKKKVREMALQMGYLPNNLVYSINNTQTKSVALVINNIKNYYYITMNERLMNYLRKAGYISDIICLFGNEFNSEIVKECIYRRVDVIISFVEPTKETMDLVQINRLPFIMVGRKLSKRFCTSLYTDDEKGGAIAANYLLSQGKNKFVYINVRGSECSIRRYRGFKNFLDSQGIKDVQKINVEQVEEYIDKIDNLDNLGLFVYNDEHLYIIIDKLNNRNIDTSKIAFIGYDGIARHNPGTKRFPSITFDYDAIARQCVEVAVEKATSNSKNKSLCFDVNLEEYL